MDNFYEILGLETDASSEDIKKSFLDLTIYADENSGKNKNYSFNQILNAFEVLSNPKQRDEYNKNFFQNNIRNKIRINLGNSKEINLINNIYSRGQIEDYKKDRLNDAILITILIPIIGAIILFSVGFLYYLTQCEEIFTRGTYVTLCGKDLKEYKNRMETLNQ